jgi:cell wall-associated NlpC family hydrolase
MPSKPLRIALALALVAFAAGCGKDEERDSAGRQAAKTTPREEPGDFDLRSRPQVVDVQGSRGEARGGDPEDDAPSPGAQSDAEVRAELREARRELRSFKHHLSTTAALETGPRARVLRDGTAVAPDTAPEVVQQVILAGNQIAKFPYKWGGGHGAWRDSGYDCSGSVSFALAGAGLLDRPLASGAFLDWGAPGRGRWITIYTNPGHIFMVVAGLRFDTSGQGRAGTRWQEESRSTSGYTARHLPGL